MGNLSYDESIKRVYFGLKLLAIVTLVEVIISLMGKGHIGFARGLVEYKWFLALVALALIGLSLYKAYFIIYEFMHMKYETPGLRWSVLAPMGLLVWAIIAFFQEGNAWGKARGDVKNQSSITVEQPTIYPVGEAVKKSKEDIHLSPTHSKGPKH